MQAQRKRQRDGETSIGVRNCRSLERDGFEVGRQGEFGTDIHRVAPMRLWREFQRLPQRATAKVPRKGAVNLAWPRAARNGALRPSMAGDVLFMRVSAIHKKIVAGLLECQGIAIMRGICSASYSS